jgi:hypothetical protein
VVRGLERLTATIGLPRAVISEDAPEFAGRTIDTISHPREKVRPARA